MKEIATFNVPYTGYLDADGKALGQLPEFAQDPENLIPLYRAMVLTRQFDEKAIALQRTGRLGTYASSLGQEAIGAGIASAMRKHDVFLPSFREQTAQILRGVTMTEILLYWGGDERGSDFQIAREDFPVCIPVGTHFPHAAGVALAFKLRGQKRVAVCAAGDGATSKGDFYEALNIAGVWNVPAVFVISNNNWAISVPRSAQTSAETLAQKAVAAGIPGEQVDGNDVIAVREVTERALARARAGDGPTLIEALTYRLGDHTTADDASRYRDNAEVSERWKEEPVMRLRKYLTDRNVWSKKDEEELIHDCARQVEKAADDYLAMEPLPVSAIFDHVFEQRNGELEAQMADALIEEAKGDG